MSNRSGASLRLLAVTALLAAVLPASLAAQTATLTGRVLNRETQAPVSGAVVRVEPQGAETLTDAQGRFRLEGLTPGTVRVQASSLGFAPTLETSVMLRTSRPTFLELTLAPQAIQLEGITVEADAFRGDDDAPTSVQRLTEVEIRRTPGGFQDISRSVLSLPGVAGGVDNRNDLLVRGGGPAENAYYLDGIRVPQINHFATQGTAGGAVGLLNVDFIQDATFFTGGFGAPYGDALSSVLEVQNRPGNRDGIAGDFTLGASEAGLTLDGPLGEEATWLFSVRRSYTQFLFQALGLPIRPNYWDAQVGATWEPSGRDRITFVGIGAIDDFDIVQPGPDDDYENQEIYRRVLDNDQRTFTVGGTWQRLVGAGGVLRLRASHSLVDYDFADRDSEEQPLLSNRSRENDSHLGLSGDFQALPRLRVGLGGELVRASIESDVFQRAVEGGVIPEDIVYGSEARFWKPSLWAQAVWKPGRLTATMGLRADGVTALDDPWTLSPRAGLRYGILPALDLTLSGGIFHQSPSKLALAVEEDGTRVNGSLAQLRNWQVVGGGDWRVSQGLRLRAEGFYKSYDQMPVLRDDPRINLANLGDDYGYVGAAPLQPLGGGRAYGLELFAQQKLTASLFFLGAYTLSWSEFSGDDGVLKPSSWDRRHMLDLTAGYLLGESWELGSKLRILSGQAYTPFDLERSALTYPVTGRGVRDWDRVGAERSDVYARLDVRAEKTFFFERWDAVVYLDLQNVLNRKNVTGYRYTQDPAFPDNLRPVEGVGLLPTFGFSIEF
jgi:hypothetical protein